MTSTRISKETSIGKCIKDGLFKLILFANMEQVSIDERCNPTEATGNLVGSLYHVKQAIYENRLSQVDISTQSRSRKITNYRYG